MCGGAIMFEIKNTEQNNKTASDYETKALLYMLARDKNSDEIAIFFIDCFNDLTGADLPCNNLWDIQSKGVKSLRPKTLGEALITLFLNYSSELKICQSLLFIPKLKNGYLIDEDALQFSISNFKPMQTETLKKGLVEEFQRREHLAMLDLKTNEKIDDFLSKVVFVVANPDEETYVKDIVDFKDKNLKSSALYKEIFREIRDKQTGLKNIYVEGVRCDHPSEILAYKKHFKKSDISIMVINRLIGIELFSERIPLSYVDEVKDLDIDTRKDAILDHNARLSKALFNKNNKAGFWVLLEQLVTLVKKQPNDSPKDIFEKLTPTVVSNVITLDKKSIIYFIHLIKDGFNNAN